MSAELWDILDFLEQLPDFQRLDEATRNELPRRMQVRYLRHDTPLDADDEGGAWLLRVGAIEVRDNRDGHLVDRVAEGGLILTGRLRTAHLGATLLEDSLLYHLPRSALSWLQERYPDWPGTDRPISALRHAEPAPTEPENRLDIPLSALALPLAPTCHADLSIREAARIMSVQRSDTLLVERHDGLLSGIVTDRDLRERVIADGIDPALPVAEIASGRVQCIHRDLRVTEALDRMSQRGIHHLPVLDDNGRARWLFSDDILVEVFGEHGIQATKRLQRALDIDDLVLAWQRSPEPLDQPSAIPLHVRLAQYNQRLKLLVRRASELKGLSREPEPCGPLAANELLPHQPLCLTGATAPLSAFLEHLGLSVTHRAGSTGSAPMLIGFFRDTAVDSEGEPHDAIDLLRQIVEPIRRLAQRYPLDLATEGCETILRLQQAAVRQPENPRFAPLIRACEQAWLLVMRHSRGAWHEPIVQVAALDPADRHIFRQGLQALAEWPMETGE